MADGLSISLAPVGAVAPQARLLNVTRDGNPLRQHGHVSPHIGKVGPLDAAALDAIADSAIAALPRLSGPTLVVGLAESSLVLAWWLAARLESSPSLCFSTREASRFAEGLFFSEPHSHGPAHYLPNLQGQHFEQILIVEDEITTGATLENLLAALAPHSRRFYVLALADMRMPAQRRRMSVGAAAAGLQLKVIDLSAGPAGAIAGCAPSRGAAPASIGRSTGTRESALDTLRAKLAEGQSDAMFMIGECVDVPLTALALTPSAVRPRLQQVTRSPWKVDGHVVHTRLDLGKDLTDTRYFLYNAIRPARPAPLIVSEPATINIAERLATVLRAQGLSPRLVEVPLR